MGISGPGPLDNDDAQDWLADLRERPSLRPLKRALRVRKARYLEVDEGAVVVVAAEVLAQLRGHPRKKPVLGKEDLSALASLFARLAPAAAKLLTRDALRAVARVADTGSELRQLLGERAPWLRAWTRSLADLKQRLEQPMKRDTARRAAAAVKRRRIEAELGSIVAIPLGKARFAFAKIYKDGAYGVFDRVSDRVLRAEEVLGLPIAFFALATDAAIKTAAWPIIGHEPFADEEAAWAPPMAAGQTVALMSSGYVPAEGDLISVATQHRGEFRHAKRLEDVIGLDIAAFCYKPELMVELLVARLVRGEHDRYRVFDPKRAARKRARKA